MSEHFDEPELQDAEPVTGCRVQSTPQTRERFASLKTKRKGQGKKTAVSRGQHG